MLTILTLPQLAHLYRQLAALLAMGLTPADAVDTLLRERRGARLRRQLQLVRDDLWRGATLSDALLPRRALFPADHCSVLAAGVAAGYLEPTFLRLSELAESTDTLRRFVHKELMPSKITFFVALPLLIGIALAGTGGTATTLAIVAGIALCLAIFAAQARISRVSGSGGRLGERLVALVPGLGAISAKIAQARFCRLFGALYGVGVPISSALRIAAEASGSAQLVRNAARAVPRLDSGESAYAALLAAEVIPRRAAEVSHRLGTGTQTGNIDQAMTAASAALDGELGVLLHRFCVSLGVVCLVVVGTLVGITAAMMAG